VPVPLNEDSTPDWKLHMIIVSVKGGTPGIYSSSEPTKSLTH
jgi:hypothetical protein